MRDDVEGENKPLFIGTLLQQPNILQSSLIILSCNLHCKRDSQLKSLTIWAYVTILNFDNDKVIIDYFKNFSDLPSMVQEEPKYFRWVDQVMSSHKAPTIDEFKVQFNLHSSRKDNVDSWVRSAMEKGVKKFQLSVEPICCGLLGSWRDEQLKYILPSLSFNSLTSLELSGVRVSSEFLEKVLHDCPLENLSVYHPVYVESLKVVGPSLKLKTFTLKTAGDTLNLEISAPNLTSFDYSGAILDFPFKSTPKLTDISIRDTYGTHLLNDFSSLLSYASQIEVLTLEANYNLSKHMRIAQVFPVCSSLKMLNILIVPIVDEQMYGLLSLIKACPLLHKFVMQFHSYLPKVERTSKTRNVEACRHDCLKVVEIKGFVGWELDYGFAEYLIENAVSLEKIIIELTQRCTEDEPCLDERKTRARQRAEQLRANLKPGTELEIHDEPLYIKWLPF